MGEPEWELSLDGLVAWLEPTQDNFYVRAKDRGGEQRSAPYSRTQYTEVEVDGFVERINNRVLNDRDFHRRRQDDKTVVASEISQITARIAKIREEGDRKVGDATERERVEQERAGSALKTAYDDWEEKAGLRPRLWW